MGTNDSIKGSRQLSRQSRRSSSRMPPPRLSSTPHHFRPLTSSLLSAISNLSPSKPKSDPALMSAARGSVRGSPTYSALYVCLSIGYYFVVSLSLTFLNKMVLTTMIKFACPLFMTWLQFVVALICLKTLGYSGRFFPAIPNHIGILEYSFSKETFSKTAALGFSYVAMYVFPLPFDFTYRSS